MDLLHIATLVLATFNPAYQQLPAVPPPVASIAQSGESFLLPSFSSEVGSAPAQEDPRPDLLREKDGAGFAPLPRPGAARPTRPTEPPHLLPKNMPERERGFFDGLFGEPSRTAQPPRPNAVIGDVSTEEGDDLADWEAEMEKKRVGQVVRAYRVQAGSFIEPGTRPATIVEGAWSLFKTKFLGL